MCICKYIYVYMYDIDKEIFSKVMIVFHSASQDFSFLTFYLLSAHLVRGIRGISNRVGEATESLIIVGA